MSHVSNGRGQFYHKGLAVKAVVRNTRTTTEGTIFLVGRNSILFHFNNWSNAYNQWIPSTNAKIQPVVTQVVSPIPTQVVSPIPKTPKRKTSKRGIITTQGRAVGCGRMDLKKRRIGTGMPVMNTVGMLQPFQEQVLI